MLHDGKSRRVAVVGGSRIPFCRAHSIYRDCSNQDMMAAALNGLVNKYDLKGQTLGDVALGAVIKHSRDWNLARESVLDSGLSQKTPAMDLQRACGTSLEACAVIANKIALGQIDAGIAGGVDSISDAPVVYPDGYRRILLDVFRARSVAGRLMPWFRLRPKHFKPELPGVTEPRTGLSMGESTELIAREWDIQRDHQDQLALASHVKAANAYDSGWYDDLVIPFMDCEEDNNIRRDSTFEKLTALRPAFSKESGATLTAGNSTPLTDGAAAVLLADPDWAELKNVPVSAAQTCSRARTSSTTQTWM